MGQLFHDYLFAPLFNLLIWLYDVIPGHDIGLAIIALTLVIRLILFPLSRKAIRSQKELQALQPKLKELQERFKDKRDELARATMALYKEHKINPLAWLAPALVQIPIILALYQTFQAGLSDQSLNFLYPFVANPGQISHLMFGIFDLSKPSVYLAVAAGLAQFLHLRLTHLYRNVPATKPSANQDAMQQGLQSMQKNMTFMFPVLTLVAALNFPAALALYWLATTIFTIAQEVYVHHSALQKQIIAKN